MASTSSSYLRDPHLIKQFILNYEEPEEEEQEASPLEEYAHHERTVQQIVEQEQSPEKIWNQFVKTGFDLSLSNTEEGFYFIQVAAHTFNQQFTPIPNRKYVTDLALSYYRHSREADLVFAIANHYLKVNPSPPTDICIKLCYRFKQHCKQISPMLIKEDPTIFVRGILHKMQRTESSLQIVLQALKSKNWTH